jgi:hypothetical protein
VGGALPAGGEAACQPFWDLLGATPTAVAAPSSTNKPATSASNASGKKRAATPTTTGAAASSAAGSGDPTQAKKAKSKLDAAAPGSSQSSLDSFLKQFECER